MKIPKQGRSCFEANRGTCLSLFLRCFYFFLKGKVNTKEKNLTICHSYTGYGPARSYLAQFRDFFDSLITRTI